MAKLGIDLGTSNTLVAKLNSDGEPEIIEIDGGKMIPSVICIEEEGGNPSFGQAALDLWENGYDADKTFKGWKLKIGEDHIIANLKLGNGNSDVYKVTPEKLTKLLIEHVLGSISHGDDGETVEEVLVTVPHGWRREKAEKCKATRDAASQAHLGGKPITVKEFTVSEPVAAAAYWLWITRKNSSTDEFLNKTLLVCDIGGGTFDLSLVVVGQINKPLDVVDADNNDFAGNYVDALLCADICRQFNDTFKTVYPATAKGILDATSGDKDPWLRGWMETCRVKMKEKMSSWLDNVVIRNGNIDETKPQIITFTDNADNHLRVSFKHSDYFTVLEPFFEKGRGLIRQFLGRVSRESKNRLPFAVVLAGGGSKIYGITDKILKPVLNEFIKPEEVENILKKIEPNKSKLDHAIVMGAALIANGVVTVQERLLHNIGFVGAIPADDELLKELQIPKKLIRGDEVAVLLTPILAKGSILPAKVKSSDFKLHCTIDLNGKFNVDIVIDDDSDDPWVQHREKQHVGKGSLVWVMEADTDGVLTLYLQPEKGDEMTIEAQLERKRSGSTAIRFYEKKHMAKDQWPRIDPSNLTQAIKKTGGLG